MPRNDVYVKLDARSVFEFGVTTPGAL